MDFIGIDLLKTSSQVCILSGDGELMERRIKSTRDSFDEMFAARDKKIKTDKQGARVLCEACRLGAYRPAHRTSERQRFGQ